MARLESVTETLDALEEELRRTKREATRLRVEFVPDLLHVELYRLAEVQLAHALESGNHSRHGGWEGYVKEEARFEAIERTSGAWIEGRLHG